MYVQEGSVWSKAGRMGDEEWTSLMMCPASRGRVTLVFAEQLR